jgi:hypothetical protein
MGGAPRPVAGERPQACRSAGEESTLWRMLFPCSYSPATHHFLARLVNDDDAAFRAAGAQVPLATSRNTETIVIPVQAECVWLASPWPHRYERSERV